MTNIEKENKELKELLSSFIKQILLTIVQETDPYNFIHYVIAQDFSKSKKNTIINIVKKIIKDIEKIKEPLFTNRFLYKHCQELLIYLENIKLFSSPSSADKGQYNDRRILFRKSDLI